MTTPLELKESYVLSCFTNYQYHKYCADRIQRELEDIVRELASGSPSVGIIRVSKDSRGNVSPWQNELITREGLLIQEQDIHVTAMQQVGIWVAAIRNPDHKKIVEEYLVKRQGTDTEAVARVCNTSTSNVSAVAKRLVRNIAMRLK